MSLNCRAENCVCMPCIISRNKGRQTVVLNLTFFRYFKRIANNGRSIPIYAIFLSCWCINQSPWYWSRYAVVIHGEVRITYGSVVNCRPASPMWPATAFSVARGMIQEKSSNHLSHWIDYICLTELLALDKVHLHKYNEQYIFCEPFCFIYLFCDQIKRCRPQLTSTGASAWITPVFFRCPGVRCLEEDVWRNKLSTAK